MGAEHVFVAGGGPAGLAAAIAARQRGFRVTVADVCRPPVDKACGEGLMPDSLTALSALGVELEGLDSGSFRGIRFLGNDHQAAAEFPIGRGVGIRRTLLHRVLVERAQQLGIEMRWGARVSGISAGAVMVEGRAVDCDWIIGADGQNSRVRQWAGLTAGREHSPRIGLRQHFAVEPWSEFVEIYWGDEGQVYVTPIARDSVCVALICRRRVDFELALEQFPALWRRLRHAPRLTDVRGAATITRTLRHVARGNVALLGEASGSADAITGEGLAMAFRQAVALAEAIAAQDLSAYERAHRKIAALPQMMGRAMLWMDKSARLRARALRALDRQPGLFARLLSLHVGNAGLSAFGLGGALDLGWNLLRA